MNQYISKDIRKVIKQVIKFYPSVIFCGSVGLVLNGLLKRTVNDIDILIEEKVFKKGIWFSGAHEETTECSNIFYVEDIEIINSSFIFPNKVKLDILRNYNRMPRYDEIDFDGVELRVEKPKYAIRFKKKYIQNTTILG